VSSTGGAEARSGTTKRRWSFPIGRVSGIEIRLHWTFFLLVALFAWAGTTPDSPGIVSLMSWLVLIFASVVVHELSHCFVGRTRGVVVHEILLLPIGGVSKLENLPDDPRDEFAIAIAGPAASAGLALVAGIAAVALGVALFPLDLVDGAFVERLFWFNLIVAGFNLLPAFPLDGGRVLRALLERRYDLERATHVAARCGRVVAIVMIIAGVFVDVWLALIGIFVYFGASAEEAATVVHLRLQGHRVGEVMLLDPVVVSSSASVAQLRDMLRRSAQRVFPVIGPGGYEGLVDARAIEHGVADQLASALVMPAAPAVAATDAVEGQLPALLGSPGRALAVLDGDQVVGVLRLEDVQHLVADDARDSIS
jgi:Zn-dependent protease